jgi:dolichol-phosphate mannosyltransferase
MEAIKTCALINKQFELIFVDDGSKDNSLLILQQLVEQDSSVHYISL